MIIIEQFISLLAPDECNICGQEGSLLCRKCAVESLNRLPDRCYRCHKQSEYCKTCTTCRRNTVLKSVWVASEYNDAVKDLVYSLKFNFTKSAAKTIARELALVLPPLPADTIIVHVPTSTSHIRKRGFDQSALIARELSVLLNFPRTSALARIGQQRQIGSIREIRRQQMKEAFRPVSETIKGMHILLIDDVLTTGSTLESAALALRRAGANTVSAAVFAQAV